MGKVIPKSWFFLEQTLQDVKKKIGKLPVISRAQLMSYGALSGIESQEAIGKTPLNNSRDG